MKRVVPPTPDIPAAPPVVPPVVDSSPEEQLFDSPQGFSGTSESPMEPRFGRILEKILDVEDAEALYDEVEKWLQPQDAYNDPGKLARLLERGEILARKAHSMWMAAKVAKEVYEIDNALIFSAMRKSATEDLETEKNQAKEAGKASKQITEADVEAKIARLYTTDYQQHQIGRRKSKVLDESLGHLVEMVTSKIRSLQTLLGKQR